MSHPFDLDGQTIWDAGSTSGQLYERLAESAATFLDMPTGLVPNVQGGCDVEPEEFHEFVVGLHDLYSRTNSAVLHGLLKGVLITSLVLLERTGRSLPLRPGQEHPLWAEREEFSRSMAAID
ncbi:DUF6086 family protein [Streptomyces microflavus]|uniref:DUF6086 family protein n=1 Tax=Streptomyces microflavus TaxID=1919 RepID=UPI00342732B5